MSKDIKEKIKTLERIFIKLNGYQKVMIVSFQYRHQKKKWNKTINKNN